MSPDDILGIWKAVKGVEFDASFGAFMGMDIRDRLVNSECFFTFLDRSETSDIVCIVI